MLDMQILSNNAVATGVGVYWMFYSGASFEDVEAPEGFPGLQAGDSVEGLRYASNKNTFLKSLNKIRQETSQHTFTPRPQPHFSLSLPLDSPLQNVPWHRHQEPTCSGINCTLSGLSYGPATTAAFCLNDRKHTIAVVAVPVITAVALRNLCT